MARPIGFGRRRHAPAAWLIEFAKCPQGVNFHPSSSTLSKNEVLSSAIVTAMASASQRASFSEAAIYLSRKTCRVRKERLVRWARRNSR
jgi:hypothetical protein